MNTFSASHSHASRTTTKALILGGGGSTGNAWLIGALAGLKESGLDVTTCDLTVGTSAGATAAAQVAGAALADLYAETLAFAPPSRPTATGSTPTRPAPSRPTNDHLDRIGKIIAASTDMADMRRRMGRAALELEAAADGTWQARWRAIVASRLPGQTWPSRSLLITAVDAATGEGVTFDRTSGVDLADAVAASCSSGLPYRVGDRAYIDGGYRVNAENADLATGYARVLVLSPFGGRSLTPIEWGTHLATQVDALRGSGSTVTTMSPGEESAHLFGANAMDLSLRPAAARLGYDQGLARAVEIAEFWA